MQGAIGRGRVSPAAVHGPEQQGGGGALCAKQGVVLPLGFLRVADQPPVVPKHLLQILIADVVVAVGELLGQRRRADVAGDHVAAVGGRLFAVLHGEKRARRQAVLRHVAVVVVDGAPLALVSAGAAARLTFV